MGKVTKASEKKAVANKEVAEIKKVNLTKVIKETSSEKPVVKEPVNLVILVDHISSGKMEHGIFTWQYRKKPAFNPLFPLKTNRQLYAYDYHFDMSDLPRFSGIIANVFPYGHHDPLFHNQMYANLTLSSWAELMKYLFTHAILDGTFNIQKEAADGTPVNITVEWKGEAPKHPELKQLKEKKERTTKPAMETLQGLDFFS